MACKVYPLNSLKSYKYVVVLSQYGEELMLSRHKARATYETQGGHIEVGESPLDAAKRELYEESGAVDFTIEPLFDYRSGDRISYADGQVFFARVTKLATIPSNSEMREVSFFDHLPSNLTYPDITPVLFEHARSLGVLEYKDKFIF